MSDDERGELCHRVRGDYDGTPFRETDSPWLGSHSLVFRPRALEAMRPLLETCGEFLPFADAEGAPPWVFNSWNIESALDEGASTIARFGSGGIMRIERHVFRLDAIAHVNAFKVPQLRASPSYLSGRVAATWNAAKLTGLGLECVWEPPD